LEFNPDDPDTFIFDRASRNKTLLSALVAYSIFNLVTMGLCAQGTIGPLPWSIFQMFIGTSIVGALLSIGLGVIRNRSRVTWPVALGAAGVFAVLTLFNMMCMGAALAAV
jgi:hypothetical protein